MVTEQEAERIAANEGRQVVGRVAVAIVAAVLAPLLLWNVYTLRDTLTALTTQQHELATQVEVLKTQMDLYKMWVTADRDTLKAQVQNLSSLVQQHADSVQRIDKTLQEVLPVLVHQHTQER